MWMEKKRNHMYLIVLAKLSVYFARIDTFSFYKDPDWDCTQDFKTTEVHKTTAARLIVL